MAAKPLPLPPRTPVRTPARVPSKTPVRKPVAPPVRIPVEVSDDDLAARVRAKADALARGVPLAMVPQPLENQPGLGALFEENAPEVDIEELDARAERSTGVAGDPDWDLLTSQMLRESCAFFAQEILTGPPEAPYKGRFLIGDHHLEWDGLIAKHDRLCILAPRDHGKTFFWDFAYPIWKAYQGPGIGFILSATQPQAERILEDIKAEIEANPKLQWLVPAKKDKWSSTSIKLSNEHRIYARGFGTKVRGAHPHWIVVDDGLNDETAYSEMVRRKQIDYFYNAISNMLRPGGQIVVIGTPFHADDLYGDLEKNDQYKHQRYRAIKSDDTPLWPERYNRERLEKKRKEIGAIRFTREFQCDPIADDMSLFPGHLFKGEGVEQPTLKLGMPLKFWNQMGVQVFMGADFAMSSSVQADYTVVFVIGLDKMGNRWLIDIVRERGLPYQEQLSLINTLGKRYQASLIFLESNQMQRIFGDELIRTTDLPIKQFVTGVQKNSLDKGVPSLRVLLENKKFKIPRGDKATVEMTDTWINEMRSFTWVDGKLQGVGSHDDTVMACWIADQAVRQGAFGFSFGDEEDLKGSLDETLAEQTKEDKEDEETPEKDEKGGSEGKASGSLVDPQLDVGLPPGLNFGYDWKE